MINQLIDFGFSIVCENNILSRLTYERDTYINLNRRTIVYTIDLRVDGRHVIINSIKGNWLPLSEALYNQIFVDNIKNLNDLDYLIEQLGVYCYNLNVNYDICESIEKYDRIEKIMENYLTT